MKKSFYLSMLSIFFVACTNDLEEVTTFDEANFVAKDVEVVDLSNGLQTKSSENESEFILKFKDESTFNRIVKELSTGSDEAALAWEKNLGFTSLNTIFNNAMKEAAYLDESENAYKTFKAKYSKYLYFPEYKEDYGAYLPVSKEEFAFVLNKNGEVMIGDEKRDFTDIETYAQLQLTGEALYDIDENIPMPLNFKEDDYIGNQYDSGWRENPEGDRRLKLKIGRRVYNRDTQTGYFALRLHFEISFRKKTWLGWSNYDSRTITTTTFTINNESTVTCNQTEEGRSSHDHYFITSYDYPNLYLRLGNGEFQTTRINGSAKIEFRGFSTPENFYFDMPGGFVFAN